MTTSTELTALVLDYARNQDELERLAVVLDVIAEMPIDEVRAGLLDAHRETLLNWPSVQLGERGVMIVVLVVLIAGRVVDGHISAYVWGARHEGSYGKQAVRMARRRYKSIRGQHWVLYRVNEAIWKTSLDLDYRDANAGAVNAWKWWTAPELMSRIARMEEP